MAQFNFTSIFGISDEKGVKKRLPSYVNSSIIVANAVETAETNLFGVELHAYMFECFPKDDNGPLYQIDSVIHTGQY